MDIYSYLKKDHKKVSDIFSAILETKNKDKRSDLYEEVKKELLIHSSTEEKTFYKALEDAEGKPKAKALKLEENMEEANEEHDEIRKYIKILDKLSVETEEWIEKLGEFKHAVEHHVKEEEETIFEKAKKILSKEQSEELAVQMEGLKQKKLDKEEKEAI